MFQAQEHHPWPHAQMSLEENVPTGPFIKFDLEMPSAAHLGHARRSATPASTSVLTYARLECATQAVEDLMCSRGVARTWPKAGSTRKYPFDLCSCPSVMYPALEMLQSFGYGPAVRGALNHGPDKLPSGCLA
eukprot:CAMPEP_0202101246 /NCGR_PEP_ID=MMETSP0965-20130614/3616_1 /ASSEMBLY_ACC=CAM_ASM_000507 /TAXON_ID=4773 /ORGANISM="Schizochytrium aggregatum, Strain ATCC28209" /LENGTH=132 /DNA_ID=CAMNT_0048669945 /DNA_START=1098 /DNA_END=1492 /DNA_ORIENTATION=-